MIVSPAYVDVFVIQCCFSGLANTLGCGAQSPDRYVFHRSVRPFSLRRLDDILLSDILASTLT